MKKSELHNLELAVAAEQQLNEIAPITIGMITPSLVNRLLSDRRTNVREGAACLRNMLNRHASGDYCRVKDEQDIDHANFYLPAGMMIQWRR